MKLDQPSVLTVAELIKEHGNNRFVDMTKFSHTSGVTAIVSEMANAGCTVHLTDTTTHAVIYNRVELSRLFGVIPCCVRAGKIDWVDINKTTPYDNPKIYKELKYLYGVNLEGAVDLVTEGDRHFLVAKPNDPTYHGRTELRFYDVRYTEIPFNLLRGYYINKFRGDYTIIPMQPYQIDAVMITQDVEYDPNGHIFGTWERDTPILTSGTEGELLRLGVPFVFELLEFYEKTDNVAVICLNPGSESYNAGNAEKLNTQWRITNPDSPIYGELVNEVRRDEMTVGIKSHMLIWKKSGHVCNIDKPEYRWVRTA